MKYYFCCMQVVFGNGVEILWDGRIRVYIIMLTIYFNYIKGMCGIWDYDRTNEYLTLQGIIELNINFFGNYWKFQKICRDELENFINLCDNNFKGQE